MQTTRGASLNSAGDPRSTKSTAVFLFIAVATGVWLLDQATKYLAVAKLEGHAPVNVIPHVFWLNLTRNPGAAFSMGTGFTALLAVIAIVVCAVVIKTATRLRNRLWAVGLGLLLAGALGNLTDRLVREPAPLKGHVVDFLQVTQHYPIFNVADISLTFAAIVIFVAAMRGVGIDGSK